MVDIDKVAENFARKWYDRKPEGCDEATLAAMLAFTLREFRRQIEREQQGEILAKVERWLQTP